MSNKPDKGMGRRKFIGTTAATAAGVYGLSMVGGSKAHAKKKKADLTMLSWNHFVPSSDERLRIHFADFSKAKGKEARVDTMAHLQLPAKHAAEAQARAGHDMWSLGAGEASLYENVLVNLDDLAEELAGKYGGWFDFGKEVTMVNGRWKAIPWYFVSFPMVIRTDLLKDVGEKVPDTWDDFLRVGIKMKKIGHPVGIQMGHSSDSRAILRGIMWGFGASEVGKDGKTITVNSPEMVNAIEYVKELYEKAMDPQVLAWDDASNNRCIGSGKCGIILNPISAYKSALKAKTMTKRADGTEVQVSDMLDHFIPPKGPAGRHMYAFPLSIGIMSWAKDIELAKDMVRFHFQKENFDAFIQDSAGYNQPLLKDFTDHPVWSSNPKFAFAPEIGKYSHTQGYPGPPTKFSQITMNLYIIPDMFAFVATGKKSTKESIAWAETQLKDIYGGRKD